MGKIIFGIIFIIGGLSGDMVLVGTDSSGECGGNHHTDDCGVCICGDYLIEAVTDTGGICTSHAYNSSCLDNCGLPDGGNARNIGCGCDY